MRLFTRHTAWLAVVVSASGLSGLGAQTIDAPATAPDHRRSREALVYVTPLLAAGWGQALNTPKAWPRTIGGYASRVGDQFGFLIVEESIRYLANQSVPWVDDRSPCRTSPASLGREVLGRIGCAVVRTSTLRTTHGDRRPNLPLMAGAVIGTGASLAWRPERQSAVASRAFVAQRLGITYGATILARLVTDWRADAKARR